MKPSLEGLFKFVILISDPSRRCANAKPNRLFNLETVDVAYNTEASQELYLSLYTGHQYKYLNSPQKRYIADVFVLNDAKDVAVAIPVY